MPAVVRGLAASLLEREELVTQVYKGHVLAFSAQLERDYPSIKRQGFFDIAVDGPEPVDIRAFLRFNDQALTETWLYQYIPFEY